MNGMFDRIGQAVSCLTELGLTPEILRDGYCNGTDYQHAIHMSTA